MEGYNPETQQQIDYYVADYVGNTSHGGFGNFTATLNAKARVQPLVWHVVQYMPSELQQLYIERSRFPSQTEMLIESARRESIAKHRRIEEWEHAAEGQRERRRSAFRRE